MCVRLVLLGGAGPEEHDLRVVAILLLYETAVRAHRRWKGRDELRVSGQVLSHHVHCCGAGGRDDERRVCLGEELRDVRAHGFRAVRRLAHSREARCLERGRDLPDRDALEVPGETRRNRCVQGGARGDEFLEAREVAPYLLRVRGAYLHAFAAGDARLGDHARLAVDDPDRLHGAVPDALVAVLAFVFRRVYWTREHLLYLLRKDFFENVAHDERIDVGVDLAVHNHDGTLRAVPGAKARAEIYVDLVLEPALGEKAFARLTSSPWRGRMWYNTRNAK